MVIHKIAQNHVGTERVRTDQVGPDRVNAVEQLSVPKLIALHLIPGALVTATFVVHAPLVKAAGLPPIAALLAAILLVLVPVELGIVLRSIRRDGGAAAVPYRQRLGPREWFWLVPVLIVPAFVGFGVDRLIEPWLIALFGWLPVWFAFQSLSGRHLGAYRLTDAPTRLAQFGGTTRGRAPPTSAVGTRPGCLAGGSTSTPHP